MHLLQALTAMGVSVVVTVSLHPDAFRSLLWILGIHLPGLYALLLKAGTGNLLQRTAIGLLGSLAQLP